MFDQLYNLYTLDDIPIKIFLELLERATELKDTQEDVRKNVDGFETREKKSNLDIIIRNFLAICALNHSYIENSKTSDRDAKFKSNSKNEW